MMKTKTLLFFIGLLIFSSCSKDKSADLSKEILAIENGLIMPIQVKDKTPEKFNILERMKQYNVPGLSIAVVQNGEIKWAKGYGTANTNDGKKVDENTLFQAGSISKPIAALSALKLVEKGLVLLDQDVNTYLKDWKVPENEFTIDEKVTLRRLLTHTAGITVHGFPGYKQTDEFPSITTVLSGKGNTKTILVDTKPGSKWRYSGGGYTIMEKLVEDISGLPFEKYMKANVLDKIKMDHSTYQQPLPSNLHDMASAAYDNQGNIIEGLWHNYPEQAAAGLWTTPSDLAKYCIEIQNIYSEKTKGILSKNTVDLMLTKDKNDWGLGPSLKNEGDALRFQHGGKNAGFTNDLIAFANHGDGVIIMSNADNGGKVIGEILRSISSYYQWDIRNPKIVETKDIPQDQLAKMTGKYKLDFQVPEIGDYLIDVEIKNGKIFVYDPNNKDTNVLTPIKGDLKFIDLEKGDEVVFSLAEDKENYEILWSGRYRFIKV